MTLVYTVSTELDAVKTTVEYNQPVGRHVSGANYSNDRVCQCGQLSQYKHVPPGSCLTLRISIWCRETSCCLANRHYLVEFIVCQEQKVWMDLGGGGLKMRQMVDAAAAANLERLGLNLRRMNRGGLNHVTYYEPEKRRGEGEGAGEEGWKYNG